MAAMALFTRLLGGTLLLAIIVGCDQDSQTQPAPSSQPANVPLAERLLDDVGRRRHWASNAVKIWLSNPTVRITLAPAGRKPVQVHAWGSNENDFRTAMMRMDQGDVLYAITDAEFDELRSAAKEKP
jgi:hypothetical protein